MEHIGHNGVKFENRKALKLFVKVIEMMSDDGLRVKFVGEIRNVFDKKITSPVDLPSFKVTEQDIEHVLDTMKV